MKILVIHSYYYPDIKGGAEYSLKKLCEGLAMRGHTLVVLCDNPYNCCHGRPTRQFMGN